jgi:hypothetical protein
MPRGDRARRGAFWDIVGASSAKARRSRKTVRWAEDLVASRSPPQEQDISVESVVSESLSESGDQWETSAASDWVFSQEESPVAPARGASKGQVAAGPVLSASAGPEVESKAPKASGGGWVTLVSAKILSQELEWEEEGATICVTEGCE